VGNFKTVGKRCVLTRMVQLRAEVADRGLCDEEREPLEQRCALFPVEAPDRGHVVLDELEIERAEDVVAKIRRYRLVPRLEHLVRSAAQRVVIAALKLLPRALVLANARVE